MGKICRVRMDHIAVSELKQWFQNEQRDLPWRRSPTPYQVWISEVMLQQTQVAVVIPYFERWMKRFPSIASLARAPLEEVIKIWEGLGYYSRVRNIHIAASSIMEQHQGVLPSNRSDLEKLKGLGPYTIGAILSFAFHQKAAAVDGNVARVLSRYYLIEDSIIKRKTQLKLEKMIEGILPNLEPWVVMEAFIELGAKVCQKVPQCSRCPLKTSCLGAMTGRASSLPNRGKKIDYCSIEKRVAVFLCGDELLLKKGREGEIMADLYEFPTYEHIEDFGLQLEHIEDLNPIKYSYTRYRATLLPSLWRVKGKKEIEGLEWVSLDQADRYPFSSGHRRLFKLFANKNFNRPLC
jgi:A/G-specific adenine glycosylase